MDEVNSKTVGVVLHSCKSLCEFHVTLQRAEDRLKRSLRIDGAQMWKTDMGPVSKNQDSDGKQSSSDRHRDRKDYSEDELKYLSEGTRRFGHSWNTILWAYPFQQGRTNVDLAKKYRKLQQGSVLSQDLIAQESAEQRVQE